MKTKQKKITLGFTDQKFDQGAHICQIFSSDEERQESLLNYLVSGINNHEKTACFTEKEKKENFVEYFAKHGIEYEKKEHSGDFLLLKSTEIYFENGKFEPENMLELLENFYKSSTTYNGARVIGEIVPDIEHVEGGARLLEYESKVSLLQKKYPVTALCQYDAREFDGSTILDILKVHPLIIIRGKVVNNPFYIPPEEFLAKIGV